jgi:predicted dehydrogenase
MTHILVIGDSNILRKRVLEEFIKLSFKISLVTRNIERGRSYGEFETVWTDLEQALSSKEHELVYISTINSNHFASALTCLREKMHVVVEKPIALSSQDVQLLLLEAKKNDLFLGQSSVWSYHRMFEDIKLLDNSIMEIKATFKIPDLGDNNFRNIESQGGGVFWDMCVYFFETLMLHPFWKNLLEGEVRIDETFSKFHVSLVNQEYSYEGFFEFNADYQNNLEVIGSDFKLFYPRAFTLGMGNVGTTIKSQNGKITRTSVHDGSMYYNYFRFVMQSISKGDFTKSYDNVEKFEYLLNLFNK